MGRVNEALRQTLESNKISQNELATRLGVGRHVVFRWFHNQVEPMAETVADIVKALQAINPDASREFVRLYLGEWLDDKQLGLGITDMTNEGLPGSDELDISALSRLFSERTNSYKFLFFLSLLDILKRRESESSPEISFQDIFTEMLANAWYPHTYFKLSFGSQDKIAEKLDSLDLEISEPILKFEDEDKELLRKTIGSQDLSDVISALKVYVPFRLLSPFLDEEIDAAKISRSRGRELDVAVAKLASDYFESKKLPYRFDTEDHGKCSSIIFHPSWVKYIRIHTEILRGWASWKWLEYMQSRNPGIPDIANKLFPQAKPDSLP